MTDADDREAAGRARAEAVGDARPATTTVEASRVHEPRPVVEVEPEAAA